MHWDVRQATGADDAGLSRRRRQRGWRAPSAIGCIAVLAATLLPAAVGGATVRHPRPNVRGGLGYNVPYQGTPGNLVFVSTTGRRVHVSVPADGDIAARVPPGTYVVTAAPNWKGVDDYPIVCSANTPTVVHRGGTTHVTVMCAGFLPPSR